MIRIKKKIEIQSDNKLKILFSEKLFKGQQGSTLMKEEWVWQGQERCIHYKTGPWDNEKSPVRQLLKTLQQLLPSRSFPQMPFCSPTASPSPNLFHYAHKLLPFGTVFWSSRGSDIWEVKGIAAGWNPLMEFLTALASWSHLHLGRGYLAVVSAVWSPLGDWLQVRPEPLTAYCYHLAVWWNREHSLLRAESQLRGNPSIAWTGSAGILVLPV